MRHQFFQSMMTLNEVRTLSGSARWTVRGLLLLWFAFFLCVCISAVSAEPLAKLEDAEGNVHFGTSVNPNLCCMCQPALDYETRRAQTIFALQYGLERAVSNERVFLSGDGKAWYCEGTREVGRFGRKCGLTPQGM
jgi:hypothetical protein